ncbi:hypothetical protein KSS87_008007, partial [Heliosperma pusillum]
YGNLYYPPTPRLPQLPHLSANQHFQPSPLLRLLQQQIDHHDLVHVHSHK